MMKYLKPYEFVLENRNKWTNKCHEEALKYKSRAELQKNNPSVYFISLKNSWLDDICSHMKRFHRQNGYWTYEKCREESLKYNKKSEYAKSPSYNAAYRNK